MRNFNIKYECYDAHDDFHAQMKAGTTPNEGLMNWFDNNDAIDDLNDDQDPYVDINGEDLFKQVDNKKLSKSGMLRQKRPKKSEMSYKELGGWMNQLKLHL